MSADRAGKPNARAIFWLLLAVMAFIFVAAAMGYQVGSDIAHRENQAERLQ